ncbi:unnamed protein product [Rotaria socialis]|uniref:Uncharacterized protein n=1 Tax=Rotaria socialis TaxID=392032 RepID=A0A821CPL6_9BILA|nr:unnamed protein product [Rotaria socialis]CAF3697300.1 unnamed protein product [Rotaria socialis]CAF4318592.1 unnamed protein product [Rotaria socialis]CAF4611221.1 unnamed protein product [Rotaria socialis]
MSRMLFPQDSRFLRDWSGQTISKLALDELQVGCIVRCVIANELPDHAAWEALYFEIVKIKNGTFWGKTLDTYRLGEDAIGLPTNRTFTFRKNHIIEIPLMWQSSFIRKKLSKYLM